MTGSGAECENGDRHYPPEADILIAAHEKSERHYFHTPHDSVLSTPAVDVEQARKLAADEYPEHGREDFELITNLCRHGTPKEGWPGCWECTKERARRKKAAFAWFFGGEAVAQ